MPATALAVALACAVLVSMHRWRARRRASAAARRARSERRSRAAERERVGRELHDTLLQVATGLVLNFQVALNRLPANSTERLSMQSLLDGADRSVDEARARVSGLRSEQDQAGLECELEDRRPLRARACAWAARHCRRLLGTST
jgi:signal transduction histidine kinase